MHQNPMEELNEKGRKEEENSNKILPLKIVEQVRNCALSGQIDFLDLFECV